MTLPRGWGRGIQFVFVLNVVVGMFRHKGLWQGQSRACLFQSVNDLQAYVATKSYSDEEIAKFCNQLNSEKKNKRKNI